MPMTEQDDLDLDNVFAEARAARPLPGDDLLRRIISDADDVATSRETKSSAGSRSRWRDWMMLLGGWPAVGGLVASTLAGLWIGVAPPAALSDLAASVWGEQVSVNLGIDVDPLSLLEG